MQFDVLVHDRNGHAVSDLKKEDFEVKDEIKLRTISSLSLNIRSHSPNATGEQAASMPTNIATNRPGARSSNVTVLLLDLYNTKSADQVYSKSQVLKFIRKLPPDDYLAIYLLGGTGLSVVHDFTNESETLQASLAKVLPNFSAQLAASEPNAANTGNDGLDSFLNTAQVTMSSFFQQDRAANTSLAFKILAQHLAGLPGRKNVVWVSGGFPINFGYNELGTNTGPAAGQASDTREDGSASGYIVSPSAMQASAIRGNRIDFSNYIESAGWMMSSANVAVYPVDARGLMGTPMTDASRDLKPDRNTMQLPQSATTSDQLNFATMNEIADLTGGKAFYNTNDIQAAIRKAIDDSAVSYTLGYYVSNEDWDGKFHSLRVKVLRPGLDVRARKGYLAQDPAISTASLESTISDAIWSPLDSTGLVLSSRIDPSKANANAIRLTFAMEPSQLGFALDHQIYRDSIDVLCVQRSKSGKAITSSRHKVDFTLTPEELRQVRSKIYSGACDVALRPETQVMRVIVIDRNSGLAGSVSLPLGPDVIGRTKVPSATRK